FYFETEDLKLSAGELVEVPVRARDIAQVEGFQFTLGFDPSAMQYAGLEPGALPALGMDNFGTRFGDEGFITASWNGKSEGLSGEEVLFTLRFRTLRGGQLSEMLSLQSMYVAAEAYDRD
ncbi:cohesin domain-containing protein, partial [Arthrospira platensis SPKY1]|nr:cohesin domain-containing protein [Arthrospira platensis SPKY1]